MDKLKVTLFAESLKASLFGEGATMQEALDYAYDVAKASGCSIHVVTAVHVLMNTVANELLKVVNQEEEHVMDPAMVKAADRLEASLPRTH